MTFVVESRLAYRLASSFQKPLNSSNSSLLANTRLSFFALLVEKKIVSFLGLPLIMASWAIDRMSNSRGFLFLMSTMWNFESARANQQILFYLIPNRFTLLTQYRRLSLSSMHFSSSSSTTSESASDSNVISSCKIGRFESSFHTRYGSRIWKNVSVSSSRRNLRILLEMFGFTLGEITTVLG
jgi:hypothetical protein